MNIIMRIEPSKRLSEMLGFPYFIERCVSVQELLDKGIISESDLAEMSTSKEIEKQIKVV